MNDGIQFFGRDRALKVCLLLTLWLSLVKTGRVKCAGIMTGASGRAKGGGAGVFTRHVRFGG